MYNRYIPGSNGIYKRQSISVPEPEYNARTEAASENVHPPEPACKPEPTQHHKGMDLGDLLLICIVVLILLDSEEDVTPIIIAIAAYLFLQ